MASDATAAVNAVWRLESARLIGALTRLTRDVGRAEDLAQDALVAALQQWPTEGVPGRPGAWLMAVAKRRAIDHFRRAETLRRRTEDLGHGLSDVDERDLGAAVDRIEDDVPRLIFLTCHPVLPPESRAALTLRLVAGLSTQDIARAFLAKDSTIGQRISRAKKALVGADFELPTGRQRDERLGDVLRVIYLIFNEGYSATAGEDWMRPELCQAVSAFSPCRRRAAEASPHVRFRRVLADRPPGAGGPGPSGSCPPAVRALSVLQVLGRRAAGRSAGVR